MTKPARRLSYAETKQLESTRGRLCRGCRTVYLPDDVPASFGVDNRTRDGLTVLCLSCMALRDTISTKRLNDSRSSAQIEFRRVRKEILIASTRAYLDEHLAHTPPRHAIPLQSIPDYPASASNSTSDPPSRRPQDAAILTRLYGKLRDAGVSNWEQLAGLSKRAVLEHIDLGYRLLDVVDEHLRAFGLDPLKP